MTLAGAKRIIELHHEIEISRVLSEAVPAADEEGRQQKLLRGVEIGARSSEIRLRAYDRPLQGDRHDHSSMAPGSHADLDLRHR